MKLNLGRKKRSFNKKEDVSEVRDNIYNLPLVNAKHGNNGIMYYGRQSDFDFAEMTIDIVGDGAIATGDVYPQPQKTGVLYNAYLIKFKMLYINLFVLIYLACSIRKSIKFRYGYDNKATWEKVKSEFISLPVTLNGEIDYAYMQNYVHRLMCERVDELLRFFYRKNLFDCNLTDAEQKAINDFDNGLIHFSKFKIGDCYAKVELAKRTFTKTIDVRSERSVDYSIPLVNAKHGSNGIMYYGKSSVFATAEMTIDIVQNGAIATGDVYPQPQKTGVLWDAYLIKSICYPDTENTLMYVATAIKKAIKNVYSYDNKAIWDRIKDESMQLPINNEGDIDFAFMENYISAQKKLIMKNVENNIYSEGNYVKSASIQNFVSIERAFVDFDDCKEVYFLGKNGDGKTLVLMALYLAFNGGYVSTLPMKEVGSSIDLLNKYKSTLRGTDENNFQYSYETPSAYLKNMFAYGTHRGRPGDKADAFYNYGFMSLFDIDRTMMNPLEWIKDTAFTNQNNAGENDVEGQALAIQKIFDEIMDRNVKIVLNAEGSDYEFEENGARVTLDELSEGYRSVIIFICDLLYRLYGKSFGNFTDISQAKGVVLVDEIDAHLHPSWQRKVVGKLRKLFPNIQFIFTTHSPSIIQGANEDAIIYKVYRQEGKTCVSDKYLKKNLKDMMMNTLVTSPLFGLDDARVCSENDDADTSNSYLASRIEKRISQNIKDRHLADFLTDELIEKMIEEAMKEEEVL